MNKTNENTEKKLEKMSKTNKNSLIIGCFRHPRRTLPRGAHVILLVADLLHHPSSVEASKHPC
eukprot:4873335-Amphidinium_carterae.1